MGFWGFAADHPFTAMLIMFAGFITTRESVRHVVRGLVIWRHGWPKPPLDADGNMMLPVIDYDRIAGAIIAKLADRRKRM